jgi:WD40 repeat protein
VEVPTRVLRVEPSPQLRATLPADEEGVINVHFSPDGKTLATTGVNGAVSLWDVASRKRRLSLPQEGDVYYVAFTPDGKRLLVPSYEALGAAGQVLRRPYATGDVKALRGGVRIFDAGSGELLGRLRRDPPRAVSRVCVTADGKTAALQEYLRGGKDRSQVSTALWDLATLKPRADVPGEDVTHAVTPDGKTLARSSFENGGVLWDIASGKARATLTRKGEHLGRCLFSRDGRTLAGVQHGPEGVRVALWDVASGKRLRQLTAGEAANVLSLALSPDGSRLAAGQGVASRSVEPCDVLVWDVKTGRQVLALRGHVNGVSALDFHPGGELLASGGSDGSVRLWEVGGSK